MLAENTIDKMHQTQWVWTGADQSNDLSLEGTKNVVHVVSVCRSCLRWTNNYARSQLKLSWPVISNRAGFIFFVSCLCWSWPKKLSGSVSTRIFLVGCGGRGIRGKAGGVNWSQNNPVGLKGIYTHYGLKIWNEIRACIITINQNTGNDGEQ